METDQRGRGDVIFSAPADFVNAKTGREGPVDRNHRQRLLAVADLGPHPPLLPPDFPTTFSTRHDPLLMRCEEPNVSWLSGYGMKRGRQAFCCFVSPKR
jgi:hypothetical protein